MRKVTSAEFQRNFGKIQDEAILHPLSITRNGRERTVLMSIDEYQKLKSRSRVVLRVTDLTSDEIKAISQAEMPSGFEHLNSEME